MLTGGRGPRWRLAVEVDQLPAVASVQEVPGLGRDGLDGEHPESGKDWGGWWGVVLVVVVLVVVVVGVIVV